MPEQSHYRILLVHCRYRLPGGEDAVFEAERAMLQAHGHEVITYERSNAEGGALQKLLLPFRAVFSFKTLRQVRALIRRHHIDVVHVHNTLLVISPSVFWACFREGVSVVQTLHNFRLFCPNGILLRDGAVCEDCPRHGLGCAVRHRCYRGSRAQSLVCAAVYAVHRWLGTYRRVNLIALTPFNRERLLAFNEQTRRPVLDPDRLFLKPNGIADPGISPRPWRERENQIVFAGRLEELKGLRTAVEAWKLLGPDAPRLIVAGDGPLANWVRENAPATITLAGRVSHGALLDLLAASKAALCPSLCYEGQPLVPIEAHAVGTPVLASNLGNVGGAVEEGVDGLHFAPGDAAALADAVRRLDALGERLDPAALRDRTLAAYGTEESYRRLMAVYREITGGQHQ
ncbi:glycosyltransferase family 4 protein [bacterium]|nr:glycosyltransferase family 4 protein [bacterium]